MAGATAITVERALSQMPQFVAGQNETTNNINLTAGGSDAVAGVVNRLQPLDAAMHGRIGSGRLPAVQGVCV